MLNNWKIGTKILIAFTVVAIVAVGLVGFFAFTTGSSALEEESFNKLTAVREMKASQIEDYFQTIENQIITLSEDRMIIEAMRRFDSGLHFIGEDLEITDSDMEGIDARLERYYQEEFLPRLIPNLLEDVSVEDYWPESKNTRILQDLYISSNPYATGSKDFFDDPGGGSSYSQAHAIYHPIIRNYLEKFGYYDIFLVDVDTGSHIAYSVFKEVDYAASLLTGPYRDSNFAEAYLAARDAEDKDFVKIVDFEPYDPSYHAPASFIASPIFDGDEKIGVMVFQMPIDRINAVMTNDQNWSAVGLGESGETYIVGDDFTLRNQSRFLIEDSENYFNLIEEIGAPLSTIARIRNINSTIGLQEVITEGTSASLSGATGTDIFPDYRGVPVLSSYKPLEITDMDWVIMSEIDQAEAFASIRSLGIKTGLAVGGLIAAIVVIAVLFSRTITRPLEQLTQTAHQLADGNLDVEVQFTEQEDEIGVLARSFDVMRLSMKDLIGELEDINRNLEQKVAERTVELEQANERVRSVIDSAPDAIITIDSEQNIVMFNPSAEKTFGYKMDEVIGQPLTMLMPSSVAKFHHNHVKDFQKGDSAIAYMENRSGINGMRKDGKFFPAEASLAKMMLGDEQFFTAILRDITERKKAEAQLHLQSSALSSAANGIVITNSEGSIEWVNPAFSELTGYSLKEVEGKNPSILNSGQHDQAFYKDLWDKINSGQVWHGEMINKRKDGTLYPEEMTITPVCAENGEIINFVAIKQDITERKQMEDRIRQSEERLNFALEGSNDGLWDWQIQTGEIFYSPRWQTMIGYEPGEIEPTIESWEKLVHPDDLSRVNEVMNAHLEGKTPQYEAEYRVQSKSGEWVWILARGKIADYDENGTPKRFVGTHVDVTERKILEEEIANQLSFIESLVDTIPNPLFVYGVDQKFITFNKEYEEAFGIKRGDYIGKTVMDMDFLPLETREATQREDASLIASGGEINREVQSKFVDGKDHDVIYQVKTFDLPGGERAGLMGLMTDISELKELERQLEQANERMSVELNFAREIQMSMLPLIFPAFPLRKELTIFATLHPAREVGGDFYDFYFLDDDHLCFVIGDVAGKGAPGALLMAVSKTLIKSRAMDDSSPSSILTHVNNELSQENESAMFVTVFLGILNVKTGELVYTNGGHNPPYIKRGDGTLKKLDAFHGPVIGAMPELTYKQDRDTLRKDDVILLYTDGVTEALDEKDQLYSDPKLVELLLAQHYKSPKEMVDTVAADVQVFQGQAEQADDITILAVQYNGELEETGMNKLDLKIKNQIEELGLVEDEFFEFAEQNQIPDADRQKVSIVLDELLNNIVNYAYPDDDEHEIEVEIELSGKRLVITIADDGMPFNPFGRGIPDTSADIDDREIGGLGIHLVRSVMDEYDYQRHINKNIVTLVKLID